MTNSASHRWDYTISKLPARAQVGSRWNEGLGALTTAAKTILADISAPARPMLRLQYLTLDHGLVICVCDDYTMAQKCFYESICGKLDEQIHPLLIHEMMPGYQQDYVFDCLTASRDLLFPDSIGLFTSREYYRQLSNRAPWLLETAVVVTTDGEEISESRLPRTDLPVPTVSCICLRQRSDGRWLLMDHDVAASVQPSAAPDDQLVSRLISHSVKISGHQLAPYLAKNFDIPPSWKSNDLLTRHCLLIFKRNVCELSSNEPGIPNQLIWSDLLGILH